MIQLPQPQAGENPQQTYPQTYVLDDLLELCANNPNCATYVEPAMGERRLAYQFGIGSVQDVMGEEHNYEQLKAIIFETTDCERPARYIFPMNRLDVESSRAPGQYIVPQERLEDRAA